VSVTLKYRDQIGRIGYIENNSTADSVLGLSPLACGRSRPHFCLQSARCSVTAAWRRWCRPSRPHILT